MAATKSSGEEKELAPIVGKKMKANGQIVEFFTLSQLATMCGKKVTTLRSMEEKKHLPPANFRDASITLADKSQRQGARLYSKQLVEELLPLFAKLRHGSRTPETLLQDIRDAFAAEKKKLRP